MHLILNFLGNYPVAGVLVAIAAGIVIVTCELLRFDIGRRWLSKGPMAKYAVGLAVLSVLLMTVRFIVVAHI